MYTIQTTTQPMSSKQTGVVCSILPNKPKSFAGALTYSDKAYYLRDNKAPYNDKVFADRRALKLFWDRNGLTYVNDEQFLNDYNIVVEELEVIHINNHANNQSNNEPTQP